MPKKTRIQALPGTPAIAIHPVFSGVFRGFRAELAKLAHFGSPCLNVAT